MKRFTETCKWDDPWFRGLTGVQKLVFLYVIDRCNNAGFWEIDEDSMAFHTKLKPELISGAWQGLGRGLIRVDGWVWVRRFLRHQKNETLNIENNAHKQILKLLEEQSARFAKVDGFDEFLAPKQPLNSPMYGAQVKVKVKDSKGSPEGKPTRDEVHEYAKEIGMSRDDADGWFDHFESNGWKVSGKTAMKDWRAALRNGKRRSKTHATQNGEYIPAAFRAPMNPPPKRPAHLDQ